MSKLLSPLVIFARIVRRDGFATFAKVFRYCKSPDAWYWLLHGGRDRETVRRVSDANLATIGESQWFDAPWYLREYNDVCRAHVEPTHHFAAFGHVGHHNPGPDFCVEEYYQLNADVRLSGINPLVHFECFGRKENRPISFLQLREKPFPEGAVETERVFPAAPHRHRRVAVFAAFFPNGRIPEATLCYLRGLKEVCDDILFVANCPVFPDEIAKLEGLVRVAVFRHHRGYDFYSYKLGWSKARELGLLNAAATDEFVLANDSCFAPVFPFPECFEKMAARRCDFWGLTANKSVFKECHVQSFFFVFRRPVLDGGALARFMESVKPVADRWSVIQRYETGLTAALVAAGHSWDTLVPRGFAEKHRCTPTKRPLATMAEFGMPLVKASALKGDMQDGRADVMEFIRARNPALAAAIPPPPPPPDYDAIRRTRWEHPASFPAKIERIRRDRVENGLPVRALFLVSSASMFPARPLFDAMLRDPGFDARIFIIPDLRWPDRDPELARRRCRDDLAAYPADRFLEAKPDDSGIWPDVIDDFGADIVSYSSPYDYSDFRYNPHWAVGRDFLPIYISYSFSTSLYGYWVFGLQNYAYFWKVFVECPQSAKDYAEHSLLNGSNAEAVGYFKMDRLATAEPWPRNGGRKRVLIAPHHSVEGGANDMLAFSNFQRYADFFLSLPEAHPELDFVFRPHPFLFTVLSRPNKWGQAKVDDWIARMKAHPNVRWSEEGDYFPAFASCDAIVQDCGSYLAEWFYTGKPCCFMLKAPSDINAKFTPLGRDCLSHCYLAYDEAAIESFLRDVVEGGADTMAAERDAFRKTIMVNYPHAADAALASIRKALGIERK